MRIVAFLILLAGISTIICVVYVLTRLKHMDRKPGSSQDLDNLAQRIAELEERSEQRLADLDERLEFAERLLAEERARHRIQAPREN